MGSEDLEFEVDVDVRILYKGQVVADRLLIDVLKVASERGSLLAACRCLGVSYSRVWDRISRAEKVLGMKIIEARRGGKGGGGVTLTPIAKKLVDFYGRILDELRPCIEVLGKAPSKVTKMPDLTIIGSHDPLLEKFIGLARSYGIEDIEVHWVGSLGGLAALVLGEADVACSHLLDENTGVYNVKFIRKFMLEDKVLLIKGYQREMGLILRPGLNIDDLDKLIEMLGRGILRIANRNEGSGTRLLLKYILKRYGIDPQNVRGFGTEYKTHEETVNTVLRGGADLCLAPRYLAEVYGLKFIHVRWEDFDFIVLKNRMNKKYVSTFFEIIRRSTDIIKSIPGYRLSTEFGKVIEVI